MDIRRKTKGGVRTEKRRVENPVPSSRASSPIPPRPTPTSTSRSAMVDGQKRRREKGVEENLGDSSTHGQSSPDTDEKGEDKDDASWDWSRWGRQTSPSRVGGSARGYTITMDHHPASGPSSMDGRWRTSSLRPSRVCHSRRALAATFRRRRTRQQHPATADCWSRSISSPPLLSWQQLIRAGEAKPGRPVRANTPTQASYWKIYWQ